MQSLKHPTPPPPPSRQHGLPLGLRRPAGRFRRRLFTNPPRRQLCIRRTRQVHGSPARNLGLERGQLVLDLFLVLNRYPPRDDLAHLLLLPHRVSQLENNKRAQEKKKRTL